ncbi:hypothetical protein NQ318_003780 [Aromia moschata]|uniref:Uncharacterized protein n=1 Tax=Aromia moschata TaxID=1265417 RepID=A0AAV8YHU9_9CUCU|nr:hypothetical protein NQ318_003780 [Aromia moschata]
MRRESDGRFIVTLPLKRSAHCLGASRFQAEKNSVLFKMDIILKLHRKHILIATLKGDNLICPSLVD